MPPSAPTARFAAALGRRPGAGSGAAPPCAGSGAISFTPRVENILERAVTRPSILLHAVSSVHQQIIHLFHQSGFFAQAVNLKVAGPLPIVNHEGKELSDAMRIRLLSGSTSTPATFTAFQLLNRGWNASDPLRRLEQWQAVKIQLDVSRICVIEQLLKAEQCIPLAYAMAVPLTARMER